MVVRDGSLAPSAFTSQKFKRVISLLVLASFSFFELKHALINTHLVKAYQELWKEALFSERAESRITWESTCNGRYVKVPMLT